MEKCINIYGIRKKRENIGIATGKKKKKADVNKMENKKQREYLKSIIYKRDPRCHPLLERLKRRRFKEENNNGNIYK